MPQGNYVKEKEDFFELIVGEKKVLKLHAFFMYFRIFSPK